MNGVERIAAERKRQIEQEGFDVTHDASNTNNQLPMAACVYALAHVAEAEGANIDEPPSDIWPWPMEWWKPSDDPIRNLEKAGALIAAEIDRRLAVREANT